MFLITDVEQFPWIVTEIHISECGLCYTLASGNLEYTAYEMEISAKKYTA